MWQKALNIFKGFIYGFLSPLAAQIARNGGKLLLEAATQAVIAAEASGGSGEDKFKLAKKIVITRLEANGIPIVLNAVHGALEGAVARMGSK